MSYATVQEFKSASTVAVTPLDGAYTDAQIQEFLDEATAWLDSQLYQSIGQATYTEIFQVGTTMHCSVDTAGMLNIFPSYFPLVSVSSIAWRVDPSDNFTQTIAATDYSVQPQARRVVVPASPVQRSGLFAEVQITYVAGYPIIPRDVARACIVVATAFASLGYAIVDPKGATSRAIVPKDAWDQVDATIDKFQRRF